MRHSVRRRYGWVLIVLGVCWLGAGCATTGQGSAVPQPNYACIAAVLAQFSPAIAETVLVCTEQSPLGDKAAARADCIRQAAANSSALALALLPCTQPPVPPPTSGTAQKS